MIGFAKSSSPNPTARSIARFGVRSTPCVMVLLLKFSAIGCWVLGVGCWVLGGTRFFPNTQHLTPNTLLSVLRFIDEAPAAQPRHHLAQVAADLLDGVVFGLAFETAEALLAVAVLAHPLAG